MKMVKGLLLAGAAGIAAVSGAQAADLPVKARAAEYVKVCSAYGAGFFYIPGTDTCIKIGGYIWAEYNINSAGSHGVYWTGANARDNKADVANYNNRVRSELSFDTRTQTEYGTLRSFIRFGPEINSDLTGYTGQFTAYRGTIQFSRAFIQFAGFTVGKTQSFFDFYAGALSYTTPMYAGSVTGSGHLLVAYTAQFGGGFSATISGEDNQLRRTGLVFAGVAGNPTAGATLGQNGSATAGIETAGAPNFGFYRNINYPDIVANLRLDQPWGSAQIMGAIHDASGGCNGACNVPANNFGSATGYAIGAGVKFNLPFAPGDELWVQGTYADGATSYLGPYKSYSTDAVSMVRGNANTAGGRYTTALLADGAIGLDGRVNKVQGYQFTVAAQHFWTPGLRTSVFGGYLKLNYDGAATAAVCNSYALAGNKLPGNGACNPDVAIWQVGTRTVWSPVANLDLGVEVLYTKVDQNHTGVWTAIGAGGNGTGTFAASDRGIFQGSFRATRNFWP
ncbi:porin omp2b precursor [Variibacter gotjawalensis]|uniref:Porin n=1 Tax=Variibacter gotjawalensis TaxID=1333996 RepID=A0A0S3PNU5_9BRAD|nr:porin [Variibacter gotjawalensis]NIK47893.1 hypothetical protein [Variibacter gotjawalensis]RZS49773.1 porin-like protein [Variibacter gotjawalensis]BAT57601.1 porin omp2b precursor [Variibacter gotjawalensis]